MFSHDKLLWDWVQELLAESPLVKPEAHADAAEAKPGQPNGAERLEGRQGSGSSAATTLGDRPQSSAGSREVVRMSMRDFAAKVLELPPSDLQQLPPLVRAIVRRAHHVPLSCSLLQGHDAHVPRYR